MGERNLKTFLKATVIDRRTERKKKKAIYRSRTSTLPKKNVWICLCVYFPLNLAYDWLCDGMDLSQIWVFWVPNLPKHQPFLPGLAYISLKVGSVGNFGEKRVACSISMGERAHPRTWSWLPGFLFIILLVLFFFDKGEDCPKMTKLTWPK